MTDDLIVARRLTELIHPEALERMPSSSTVLDLARLLTEFIPQGSVGAPDGARHVVFTYRDGETVGIRVPDDRVPLVAQRLTSGRSSWLMDVDERTIRRVEPDEIVAMSVRSGGTIGLRRDLLSVAADADDGPAVAADGDTNGQSSRLRRWLGRP